jgi:hypothetical protein
MQKKFKIIAEYFVTLHAKPFENAVVDESLVILHAALLFLHSFLAFSALLVRRQGI